MATSRANLQVLRDQRKSAIIGFSPNQYYVQGIKEIIILISLSSHSTYPKSPIITPHWLTQSEARKYRSSLLWSILSRVSLSHAEYRVGENADGGWRDIVAQ